MRLTPKQLATTLVDHCDQKTTEEVAVIVKDFVQFLAQENQINLWRRIEEALHSAWKEKYGVSNVTIVSAHALTSEAKASLQEAAKGADVHERVDDRLIGGAILRVDDTRIDGSITGALRRMKLQLTH